MKSYSKDVYVVWCFPIVIHLTSEPVYKAEHKFIPQTDEEVEPQRSPESRSGSWSSALYSKLFCFLHRIIFFLMGGGTVSDKSNRYYVLLIPHGTQTTLVC